MKRQAGFSLVELLVASTIMLMVFAMVYTALIQTRKIALRHQMDAELLQHARIGVDELTRTLRMAGYRRDRVNGQPALLEAAPFQFTFNADLRADYPALTSTGMVYRYDGTAYIPFRKYTTGAETIRWTLDSNDDGLVDRFDTNDDEEEQATSRNPNDLILLQEFNGGYDRQIPLNVRGPFTSNNAPTNQTPLFQYWVLGMEASKSQFTYFLWGDCDRNGQLDGNERYFRPITSQWILEQVHRIQVTLTTESNQFDPLLPVQRRQVTLSTSVSLRNIPFPDPNRTIRLVQPTDCCPQTP